MSTDSPISSVPQMHAETGFDESELDTPVRVSGFVTLALGLVSVAACFGTPLLVFPVAALLIGCFALRRSDGGRPIGTTPAMIGMAFATAFGSFGLFVPWFKTMELGRQAEKFSLDYVEVIARGDDYYAMELEKDYANRFPRTMNLSEFYSLSEQGQQILQQFSTRGVMETIRARGPGAVWELDEPVQIKYSFGSERATVVLRDPTGQTTSKIRVYLHYVYDSKGNGQWHVDDCMLDTPRYVAPAIL